MCKSGRSRRRWRAARPAALLSIAAGVVGACASPLGSVHDTFRHPEFPQRTASASTYPWVSPDAPSAVKVSAADGVRQALVFGDVIVLVDRLRDMPHRPVGASGVRVRGVDQNGDVLFTGPALAAEAAASDSARLSLLGSGSQTRIAFTYHKTRDGVRATCVDLYDPASRGHVRPVTVRLPTDEPLEWAGDRAIQGAIRPSDGPVTILDADGTLASWHRPGWQPVAATGDVVVDARRGGNDYQQGFQVVDRRTKRVLWSRPGQVVYAVSDRAVIAGRTRRFTLSDLRTGRAVARGHDPLPNGGLPATADGTRQHGDLILKYGFAGSLRHRWVHGGWDVGYYAIWQDNLYGFQGTGNSAVDHPMALWIPPSGTPHRFPVTGDAAPLGVTPDGHAVALTGNFRKHDVVILPLRH